MSEADDSWFTALGHETRIFLEDAFQLQKLLYRGAKSISHAPELSEKLDHVRDLLGEDRPTDAEARAKELEELRALAAFAKAEIAGGFERAHSHLLVGMWGALEAWAGDLVTEWLLRFPDDYTGPPRVRVSADVLLSGDNRERVASMLRQAASGGAHDHKPAALLAVAGLAPDLSAEDGRLLTEVAQVRHAIAHNGRRVDREFIRRCPWRDVQLGEPIALGYREFNTHAVAMVDYFAESIVVAKSRLRQPLPPSTS